MEDVLTDIPPPSRFFEEDLNIFTPPSAPLPTPLLLLSEPYANETLRPSLLIFALSAPSLHIFHHASSKTLVGSLILPEISDSGNPVSPSLKDKSCNIYSLNDTEKMVLVVSVQLHVPPERCHAASRLLLGEKIVPERVLILDSIQIQKFRAKLSRDDTVAYKLETSSERKGSGDSPGGLLRDLEYYPSGSLVDGLAAALFARCQIRNIKAQVVVRMTVGNLLGLRILCLTHSCTPDKGCDGSVLLDDTITLKSEKKAAQNNHSLRGFKIMDRIKMMVESECPGVVSCADILTIAARDAVILVGGPYWDVPLGRKDARTANYALANANLPGANEGLVSIIAKFINQGLSVTDMVALSGAHTIGMARCESFRARLYGDLELTSEKTPMAELYINSLRLACPPFGSSSNNVSALDYVTPNLFDNSYYQLLVRGQGLLNSDQEMYSSLLGIETRHLVQKYAEDPLEFFKQFAESMVKMGNITNYDSLVSGEVRKNCRFINSLSHSEE